MNTKVEFKGKYYGAVGRRKEAVARVRLYEGKGNIIVNGKDMKDYFRTPASQDIVISPLKLLGLESKVDISVIVSGGGINGQRDAVRHGISRSLLSYDKDSRTTLKKSKFLTRDPRAKERKKPGLKRARKAPQFSKR